MRVRWPPLLFAGAAAVLAAAAFAAPAAQDRLLYNHSPSVPVGLYLRTDQPVARGALVTVRAARVAPNAAARRGFTGPRDRFLKRVAALAGDRVCAEGATLLVNDVAMAERRTHDSEGRPLAAWSGCRVLGAREVLLLGDNAQSFDGRYWGPIAAADIEGVWRPLF